MKVLLGLIRSGADARREVSALVSAPPNRQVNWSRAEPAKNYEPVLPLRVAGKKALILAAKADDASRNPHGW